MTRTLAIATPMSTGDIVGRSFRIFRQNILMIGKILVLPTIFICLGRIGVLVGISYGVKFMNNPKAGIVWLVVGIVSLLVLLAGVILLWIRQLALARYLIGFANSYQEARQQLKGRIFSLIVLFIATFVSDVMVLAFWSIVMVLSFPALKGQGYLPVVGSLGLASGILGLIITIIFISLVFNLVAAALALNKADLVDLIGEGFALTLRAFVRSIGFHIITAMAVALVVYPLSLPMVMFIFGYTVMQGAFSGSPPTEMPMYIEVFNSVWGTIVNMIIGPIYYLAYALYYCDLRMRQEGTDLVERIVAVEAADHSGRLSSHGI